MKRNDHLRLLILRLAIALTAARVRLISDRLLLPAGMWRRLVYLWLAVAGTGVWCIILWVLALGLMHEVFAP